VTDNAREPTPTHHQLLLELGRILLHEASLDDLMKQIADTAKAAIPPVAEASVTFTRGDDTGWTVAATGGLAMELDEAQYATHQGPCMDAAAANQIMLVEDFATEERWPEYTPRALASEARSSLSVPMPVQQQVLAALNLYAVERNAFSPEDVAVAVEIASYAAVAVTNAHNFESAATLAAQLTEAMASRAVIEQAKGVIMATAGCAEHEAFQLLRAQSQRENVKLRDVAMEIVGRQDRRRA
jgi:GAF domain-containing protein